MNFYPPPRGDAVHHNFVIIWEHFYSLQLIFGEQGEDIKIAVEVEHRRRLRDLDAGGARAAHRGPREARLQPRVAPRLTGAQTD